MHEVTASGREALEMATHLLQRVRRADPEAGLWEAADVQWWWRKPRPTDTVDQHFWVDDDGPVAGVWLTSWGDDGWQVDPLAPHCLPGPGAEAVWARASELVAAHAPSAYEVPVSGDDPAMRDLVEAAGLVADLSDHHAWLDLGERPAVRELPEGLTMVDRAQRADGPHWLVPRNGEVVEERLRELSLYDPGLDLAVETEDGRVAGYSVYWFDPTTRTGLVEPVRVEDDHQRRGLASAMLTAGLDRLAAHGAERVKIGYQSEAAAAVYLGIGFRPSGTGTWYAVPPAAG